MLYALIFLLEERDLQFKVYSERQILRNFSYQFYILSEFFPEIVGEEDVKENVFLSFYLRFNVQPGA